jgi:hypothetical protein
MLSRPRVCWGAEIAKSPVITARPRKRSAQAKDPPNGRQPLSSFRLSVPPRTGRSVLSGLADAAAAFAWMMSGAARFCMVLNVSRFARRGPGPDR